MGHLLLPGLNRDQAVRLEDQLRSFLSNRELPLYRMMAYQMGWVDENGEPLMSGETQDQRLHGQFVLSVAGALGADPGDAVDYALPVELARNAALIHEDVEDGNTDRMGRPSVWWTWGPAQAINAGDGMQAMARLSIFTMLDQTAKGERVFAALEALDDAVLHRCEGEYLDITYQERLTLSEEQYLEMAEGRTGSLIGGAGVLGSIAADVSERPTLDAIKTFGRKVGAACQVRSDMDALWGERDQVGQGRLITKKKNLAIVHALEHGDATLRRTLGELYMQRVLDPNMIGQVAELAGTAGGREFCQQTVDNLVTEAGGALSNGSFSGAQRDMLMECAKAMTSHSKGSV